VGVVDEMGSDRGPHKVLSQLLPEDTEENKNQDISRESNHFFRLCVCISVHPHLCLWGEREEGRK
jgi:hypothetical protein